MKGQVLERWSLTPSASALESYIHLYQLAVLHASPRMGFVSISQQYTKGWVLFAYLDTTPNIGFCWLTLTIYPRLRFVAYYAKDWGFVGIPWHDTKDWVLLAYLARKQCLGCAQTEIQVLSAHNPDYQTFSLSSQNGSEYSLACFAYCQELSLNSTVLVLSASLFSKASSAIKWPGS